MSHRSLTNIANRAARSTTPAASASWHLAGPSSRPFSLSSALSKAPRPSSSSQQSAERSPNAAAAKASASSSDASEPTNAGGPSSSPTEPPTFGTSTSALAAEADAKPLPFLSVPLGVPQKPSARSRSWAERKSDLFDTDVRMAKREAIVKEATRGYFHDFHAIRSHGGKTWRAPGTLIKQDRALYFPAIAGQTLKDKSSATTASLLQDKVSIVTIMSSQISAEHCKSFYQPALDLFGRRSGFQLVQINLQENALKAYLVSFFMASLRRAIEPWLHPTYLLSTQNMELLRSPMGLQNKHVGYTYLVGPDMKIRWAGCAFAEEREKEALVSCTGVLLNRAKEMEATSRGGGARR